MKVSLLKSFSELGVPTPVSKLLAQTGKTEPFAIQRDTLPDSLAGRDILGRGQTGSGKTLAFSIPMVATLGASNSRSAPNHPRGLILAPTRELATQIAAEIKPLASAYRLKVATVFGGVSQRPQEKALRQGVDIVVACPGRLEDLMRQKVIFVDQVEITVLDEADHMADLGFLPSVNRILESTPADGQRMLFSATLDREVNKIVNRFLTNPAKHEVDDVSVPTDAMSHRLFVVKNHDEKIKVVHQLASGSGRRILFTRTKHGAEKLATKLTKSGIPAVDLHGNLSQRARDRNLAAFSKSTDQGGVRVLVATDVAARGVHVSDVEMVIHVDPPAEHKAYLHRSGRTARAGATGSVVTVAMKSQRRDIDRIFKKASVAAQAEFVEAGSPAVTALVGVPAPYQAPGSNNPYDEQPRPRNRNKRKTRSGGSGEAREYREFRESRDSDESRSSRGSSRSDKPRGYRGSRGSQENRSARSSGDSRTSRSSSDARSSDRSRTSDEKRNSDRPRGSDESRGSRGSRGPSSRPKRRATRAERTARANRKSREAQPLHSGQSTRTSQSKRSGKPRRAGQSAPSGRSS